MKQREAAELRRGRERGACSRGAERGRLGRGPAAEPPGDTPHLMICQSPTSIKPITQVHRPHKVSLSNKAPTLMPALEPRPAPVRWVVLAQFALAESTQGLMWMTVRRRTLRLIALALCRSSFTQSTSRSSLNMRSLFSPSSLTVSHHSHTTRPPP